MVQSDISFGFVVSQEVMLDVYVLCARVVYRVVCQLNGTLIVTQKGHFGFLITKVFKGLLHPK
jgi:hypothetical protein